MHYGIVTIWIEEEIYYESPRSQARRAQTDWVTSIKGGAQCPQGGRLCAWFMHYEILVEGQSELTLLSTIMPQILGAYNEPHT